MARPRHLVLKALAKAVKATVPAPTDIDDGIPTLQPGEMQLYSFFVPGLLSEEYNIQVSQHVERDGTELDLKLRDGNVLAQQKFYVQGPQFVIPAADFHSSYPPQGHADQPSVRLPLTIFGACRLTQFQDCTAYSFHRSSPPLGATNI